MSQENALLSPEPSFSSCGTDPWKNWPGLFSASLERGRRPVRSKCCDVGRQKHCLAQHYQISPKKGSPSPLPHFSQVKGLSYQFFHLSQNTKQQLVETQHNVRIQNRCASGIPLTLLTLGWPQDTISKSPWASGTTQPSKHSLDKHLNPGSVRFLTPIVCKALHRMWGTARPRPPMLSTIKSGISTGNLPPDLRVAEVTQ